MNRVISASQPSPFRSAAPEFAFISHNSGRLMKRFRRLLPLNQPNEPRETRRSLPRITNFDFWKDRHGK